jgi:Protein of unknown function (DUF4233)
MAPVTRILASATLVFEAFSVFFGGLVAKDLSSLSTSAALIGFSLLALACLVTAGLLRARWGFAAGSVLQVAIVASGFWVTSMFVVGGAFALLWIFAIVLGERAARTAAGPVTGGQEHS